ncbi:alpha/beta hydrolase [Williamsia sp. CHRR-6]|uniref:alpha/beta hydrolase n=1 Tax=Williamsia sp. CHRR-6 TaxID=2835871 RepID=UPI001BDAA2DD|nr:alpha/beta hydrolase [Williamsia sp. CHRR-6]MBT0568454.1 alpha/beta hydrolase [Williamsia sp. CHRR-6]
MLHPRLPLSMQRALADRALELEPLPADARVSHITLGGRPAEVVTVGSATRAGGARAVLYLHGGGYTMGSPRSHRRLVAHLAAVTGVTFYSLHYRLAPEDPCPAAVIDAVAAFRDLVEHHGIDAEHIAIAGDSAGGGLSVATARRLIDDHGLHPAALGLIAPWVNPGDVDEASYATELVANYRWAQACADAYLGGGDPGDPRYAPLLGNLSGLPPAIVHVGRREALHRQVSTFVDALRAAQVEVEYVEFPRLWHVGHQQAGMLKEAADAVEALGTSLRAHLD